ncbi:MAG TPA: RIP metalloprotease RseP [Flammeovirgaceae bacterium]|nr:RIP metalloprotease RseP [Flammeovirgaceae bacterium]
MEGLIMAAQIILSLSILVGLHEFGHLIAAKLFGMRVEKYSIGFPPKIFGFKAGETEYSIGAIPLGGFVKISGMVDESLDTKSLSAEPQPWEFRAKPAWQRLIVMLGGIIVNVITGILIFIGLTYYYGETFFPMSEINKYGIKANELAEEIGLQTGDRIIGISGQPVERFEELMAGTTLLGDKAYYTVVRGSDTLKIFIPDNLIEKLSDKRNIGKFIEPLRPFKVGEVMPGSAAAEMGLQPGDEIVAVNGMPVKFFNDFEQEKFKYKGQEIELHVKRDGQVMALRGKLPDDGILGFRPEILLNTAHHKYSLLAAVPIGTAKAFTTVWINIKGLGKLVSGQIDPRKSLMGPIGIARVFGGTWNWQRFWNITGMLSMILAFMNLLPIPALDGGHVMFLSYEIISGRAPGDRFLETAQKVGMAFLLALMIFIIGNDIFNLFN